jgi:phage-related holin
LWGAATGFAALFAPVQGMVLCAVVFVAVDFVTGVVASRARARRAGSEWRFSSRRAWDTLMKLVFVMAGITLAGMLDGVMAALVDLHLARIFTGFVCGVEFWSYLENAADISGQPVFKALGQLLKKLVDKALKK